MKRANAFAHTRPTPNICLYSILCVHMDFLCPSTYDIFSIRCDNFPYTLTFRARANSGRCSARLSLHPPVKRVSTARTVTIRIKFTHVDAHMLRAVPSIAPRCRRRRRRRRSRPPPDRRQCINTTHAHMRRQTPGMRARAHPNKHVRHTCVCV